jgi:hypothetical protein
MKKRVNLPNRMVFRYGEGTQYWMDKGMELGSFTNTSRFIRKAIEHYVQWLIISKTMEEKGDEK